MKTTRILLLAAATLLAACNQENMLENTGNDGTAARLVPMTFTAGTAQTRTQLADGKAVNWVAGDAIAVWDGTEKREFTATAINGSSATFTGQVTDGSQTYTAFYPHDLVTAMNGTSITFTLPAEQTATAGSFANGLAPSWAQATDGSTTLTFQNLCALVKFTVASNMAGEGIFTLVGGNATEPLAGSLTYTIGSDESNGTLAAADDAATRVTLSGNFVAGKAYYFVVAPGALEKGFSLLYENSEGKQYRRATTSSASLTAGRILNLGEQTLNSFESALTNSAIIDAVGDAINLDKQEDGTVSLTQSNLEKIAKVTELNLSDCELTSLSGIEYFTGLTTLDCSGNKLTSLDFSASSATTTRTTNSAGLTSLTVLDCSDNLLTTLNVDGLTNLEKLDCGQNRLTTLTVTGLPKLTRLDCAENQLTAVSVSNLPALNNLKLEYNQLTAIDVSTVPSVHYLGCYGNRLTTLDVSKLTQLEGLYCYENCLSSLDISMLSDNLVPDCNNQQTASGSSQMLTLYLSAAQKKAWEEFCEQFGTSYPDVTLVVK